MTRNRFGSQTSRLHLEYLEDRATPSTFSVTTKLDVVDPADGKLSLREAISKANTHAGPDTIVLPAGVFKITQTGADEDANATGDFDITDAMTIQGAGAGVSIIDGQRLDRVFDVLGSGPSSITAVFAGLTIRAGNATGDGGGIRFGNANLVTRDCIVSGNRASANGGGISNTAQPGTGDAKVVRTTVAHNVAGAASGGIDVQGGSVLTAIDSTIRHNVAHLNGGGIFAATTATLTGCTVSGNFASGSGGGIFAAIAATLTGCTVSGNFARSGGGGIAGITVALTNCAVSGNSAGGSGGGISSSGSASLTRSTLSGNSAVADGGGLFATTTSMTNCTISGNSAGSNGGGISISTGILTSCTVSGNSAGGSGGGIACSSFGVKNTIVALNLTDFSGSSPDVSGGGMSQGHNLIGDGSGSTGFTNGTNGDIVGDSINPIDPKLGPLANNGGPTQTMALLAGSPAIDHGDNAALPPTDQRGAGFARKKDGNFDGLAIVDIGAFER